MGSGKSTIGAAFSAKAGMPFFDMDDVIIEMNGGGSIQDIFNKKGEIVFREYEIAAAKELVCKEGSVIATGGGVVLNKIILDYLMPTGTTVFLDTPLSEIEYRLRKDALHPLFQDARKLESIYVLRRPLYNAYCDICIKTEGKAVAEIVEEVMRSTRKGE
jgi:shikimate kinase